MEKRIDALMDQFNCSREEAIHKYNLEIAKNSEAILASGGVGPLSFTNNATAQGNPLLHELYENAAAGAQKSTTPTKSVLSHSTSAVSFAPSNLYANIPH